MLSGSWPSRHKLLKGVLQVVLVLDKPIWPQDFFDVVCPGSFFPELWVTRYPPDADKAELQLFSIVAFACGHKAEQISKMRDSSVVLALLRQLDEIFGLLLVPFACRGSISRLAVHTKSILS